MEETAKLTVVAAVTEASGEAIRKQMTTLLPRLRRFAVSLTGNMADADDLVQDTVERALRNLHRWQPDTRLDSWMYRIAQNLWIDTVRARRVRQTTGAEPPEDAAVFDGARAAEARLTFAETCRALAGLPEEQRAVVALVVVEGLAYREVAEILGIPIGTVTSRLARAREALAARVFGAGAVEAKP
jgi:RNA polymerase sigma-70 factor (ECF subfamily)